MQINKPVVFIGISKVQSKALGSISWKVQSLLPWYFVLRFHTVCAIHHINASYMQASIKHTKFFFPQTNPVLCSKVATHSRYLWQHCIPDSSFQDKSSDKLSFRQFQVYILMTTTFPLHTFRLKEHQRLLKSHDGTQENFVRSAHWLMIPIWSLSAQSEIYTSFIHDIL